MTQRPIYSNRFSRADLVMGDIVKNRIDATLAWLDDHPEISFDTTFLENLQKAFKRYNGLTPKQWQALANIIERFNMELEEYGDKPFDHNE